MNIGEEIKRKRQELGLTQEELAEKINVSRSTVSNWEIGRNYPDIKSMIILSELFEISLEELLRENEEVVEKIAEDTKVRKLQSKKIKILYAIITILIIFGVFCFYKSIAVADIRDGEQIVSAEIEGNQIRVLTQLPTYKSIGDYIINSSPNDKETIQISLSSRLDLSFKNNNEIIIPMDSSQFKEIKNIEFIYDGKKIKSI